MVRPTLEDMIVVFEGGWRLVQEFVVFCRKKEVNRARLEKATLVEKLRAVRRFWEILPMRHKYCPASHQ